MTTNLVPVRQNHMVSWGSGGRQPSVGRSQARCNGCVMVALQKNEIWLGGLGQAVIVAVIAC